MAKKAKHTTIKDIAKYCDTSTATVSRVLSGSSYPVTESLSQQIIEAAKKLDYHPNVYGRMLRGARNFEVGILVPNVSDPYYGELVSAAERVLLDNGYMPVIGSYYNNPSYIQQHITNFRNNRMAGMLLSTSETLNMKRVEDNQDEIPIVFFDQAATEGWEVPQVTYDYKAGGRMAAEYLLSRGLKNIAFVVPSFDRASRKLLYEGILEETKGKDCSLTVLKAEHLKEVFSYQDHIKAAAYFAKEIIDKIDSIDALIVNNDMLAATILSKLIRSGINVPEQISIIGFDDIWLDEMFVPKLTTIRQSTVETGKAIANMLLKLIQKDTQDYQVVIEPQLIVRESVI